MAVPVGAALGLTEVLVLAAADGDEAADDEEEDDDELLQPAAASPTHAMPSNARTARRKKSGKM